MTIEYDRYYRYDAFTSILRQLVHQHPRLLTLASIGKSHEGRDIWVVTVTNQDTGPALDKPAYWVDANIHASELASGAAALYLIDMLTREYGRREDVTRCLDTRAFYVCPRINPDGAEWAMRDTPKIIRSSTRPYPYDEEPVDGLDVEDVDGDGRILSMRIADANGNWKCHPDDPRLMVAREPTEAGGQYYRILPEGRVRDYDGFMFKVNRNREGLDLNRNFPAGWRQEFEQVGAGPYPASEPEVRAVVHFITHHANITGGVCFHTWSGVLLRPFGSRPDDEMPAEDLWVYQAQGDKGTELTGYPAISTYHEFRYHPKEVTSGGFEWIYEHLGLYKWTVEIWCPMREAGITDYKYIDWFRSHPVADDLKLLAWSDTTLEGKGFVDWYPFEHPELGPVEIGGWNKLYAFNNPPPHLLENEVRRFPDWLLWNALTSPRLELVFARCDRIGDDACRIEVGVQNTGHLPSYVSRRALQRQQSRGLIGEIVLPDGVSLVSGQRRLHAGELEGRAYKHSLVSFMTDGTPMGDRAKLQWLVRGPAGAQVPIVVRHDKAGTVRTSVTLP
ncbi:M14 family metallopeptidase [Comamonadaceae bacterium G21597-S1]|nr:M14 family metallopeptidase [Comamonadaceae bacterium G21597-S1]